MTLEQISEIWPGQTIEKEIGRGSYGTVYKVASMEMGGAQYYALKVISIPSDDLEIDSLKYEGLNEEETKTYFSEVLDDFKKEIRTMEELSAVENIVQVRDYKIMERKEGIGWDILIRMEYLTPLNVFLSDKNLTEKEVIRFGIDMCKALSSCHKRGIMHRDVKPENIFVDDFGNYKLGDFGIARRLENLSYGMSQKGTFNYIAPEVVNGSEYDTSVDIYSLGLVLYRLLNKNRLPFLDTEKQILSPVERKTATDRRLRGEALPAPCEASREMSELILTACDFDPSSRFQSADDMLEALTKLEKSENKTGHGAVTSEAANMIEGANVATSQPGKTKSGKTKPVLWVAAIVLACSLMAGGAFLKHKADQASAGQTAKNVEESSFAPETPFSDEATAPEASEAGEQALSTEENLATAKEKIANKIYKKGCEYLLSVFQDADWLNKNYVRETTENEEIYITNTASEAGYLNKWITATVDRYYNNACAELIIAKANDSGEVFYFYRATEKNGDFIGWVLMDGDGNYMGIR